MATLAIVVAAAKEVGSAVTDVVGNIAPDKGGGSTVGNKLSCRLVTKIMGFSGVPKAKFLSTGHNVMEPRTRTRREPIS